MKVVIRMMSKWVSEGNTNCQHMLCLLEAELARIGKQHDKAVELYKEATLVAARSGHVHDAGICHERVALFHVMNDNRVWSQHHLKQAATCFEKWGAGRKVRQLYAQYSHLVDESEFFSRDNSKS